MDVRKEIKNLISDEINISNWQVTYIYPDKEVKSLYIGSIDFYSYLVFSEDEYYEVNENEKHLVYHLDYVANKVYDNYNYTLWLVHLNQIEDFSKIKDYDRFLLIDEEKFNDYIYKVGRIIPEKKTLALPPLDLKSESIYQYLNISNFISSFKLSSLNLELERNTPFDEAVRIIIG